MNKNRYRIRAALLGTLAWAALWAGLWALYEADAPARVYWLEPVQQSTTGIWT